LPNFRKCSQITKAQIESRKELHRTAFEC